MNDEYLDGPHALNPFSRICSRCAHKHLTHRHTCDAFPNGIPDEIWDGATITPQPIPATSASASSSAK